jgi:hypothetical protein
MDALAALRSAYASSRAVSIEGSDVVIDGERFAGSTQSAFRGADKRFLTLSTLVAFWEMQVAKPLPYHEYMKQCVTRNLGFVIVSDKDVLSSYLRGKSEAAGRVEVAPTASTPGGAAAAATTADAAVVDDGLSIRHAVTLEQLYRTRATVLECPTRNLREKVFEHFTTLAGASSTAAPAPVASGKRGGASGGAEPTPAPKRAREDPLKSFRGTPIIVVPASGASMINMYNVKALLQDGVYVRPDEACVELRPRPTAPLSGARRSPNDPPRLSPRSASLRPSAVATQPFVLALKSRRRLRSSGRTSRASLLSST